LPVADIIRRNRRETLDQVLQFPEDLGAHAMLLSFKKYSYRRPGTPNSLNRLTSSTLNPQQLSRTNSILVPLPQNIQDSYQVRVQRFDQGIAGEAIASAASTLGSSPGVMDIARSVAEGMPTINADAITKAVSEFDFSNLSRDAAFLARRAIDSAAPQVGRNLDAGFGATINPKAALYFEGVEMKTHTFNWTFAPASERESTILKDIGNTIKKNILPSYGSLTGAEQFRFLLNYPSVLDIFFLGVDQSYFLHYKTCMVQQFNIDFTPQGIALLKGGKPAMVNMNMGVIESDIHTSEDYDDGSADIRARLGDRDQAGRIRGGL
jgi:hypothetical protein